MTSESRFKIPEKIYSKKCSYERKRNRVSKSPEWVKQ